MTKSVKFLDPREIEETIIEVAELARRYDLEIALIGGVAMAVYGSDRLTKDVDFASCDEYLPELSPLKQLSFGGVAATTPGGHPIDLVVRDDEYKDLYTAAVEHARDESLPVKVVTPEYLAALKLAAARDKDEIDLKYLVSTTPDGIDLVLARKIIRKYLGEYAAREFDQIVSEVEWKRSRLPEVRRL